jgi:hypothetical protein
VEGGLADLRETSKAERARAEELRASCVGTVRGLAGAVEARDADTGKHAERVAAADLFLTTPFSPLGLLRLVHDVGDGRRG